MSKPLRDTGAHMSSTGSSRSIIDEVMNFVENLADQVNAKATQAHPSSPPKSKVYALKDGSRLVLVTSLGLSIGDVLILAREGKLYVRIGEGVRFRRAEVLHVLKISVDTMHGMNELYADKNALKKEGQADAQ